MNKISIYIHIPFCIRKCAYCDFLSAPAKEAEKEAYVKALCKEIAAWKQLLTGYEIDTVFFGGGTPSCLEKGLLEEILQTLKKHVKISGNAEITVEVNPGTVDITKLKSYREAGVNRLSIGLQSFHEEDLKVLGRIHTLDDFMSTYKGARVAGFENINIDLMSALPRQSVERYKECLKKAVALNPEHISAYSLIVEEGTPFYERYGEHPELLPTEDDERKMYALTAEILRSHGYKRYEISNYAKDGYECRHNLKYWKRGEYIGFGLGSSSLFCEIRFKGIEDLREYCRFWQPKQEMSDEKKDAVCGIMQDLNAEVVSFLTTNQYQEITGLSIKEQMEEFMFLGLRCMEGIRTQDFSNQFNVSIYDIYEEPLEKHKKAGFLGFMAENLHDAKEGRFFLTQKGIDVSNTIFCDFLL